MGQPFSKFDILRARTERQEIAPHIQRRVLLLEEILGSVGVIGHRGVNGQIRVQRRGVGDRGGLVRLKGRRAARASSVSSAGILIVVVVIVVVLVTTSAEPLATKFDGKHG